MTVNFTCEHCEEKQTQELEGMFGANLQYGGIGFAECVGCNEKTLYIVPFPENPFNLPEEDYKRQQTFWENWKESMRLWELQDRKHQTKKNSLNSFTNTDS